MKTMNPSSTVAVNPIVTIMVAVATLFCLSACSVSPAVSEQTDSTIIDKDAVDAFAYQDCVYPPTDYVQACSAQQGEFLQQGMLGCYSCIISYDDAGKSCQDSADCQGVCESVGEFVASGAVKQTGQCSANSSPFGCRQAIENGVAGSAICID